MDDQLVHDAPEVQELIDSVLSVMPETINMEILIYMFVSIIYVYGMEDKKEVFAEEFSWHLMQAEIVPNGVH